MCICTSGGSGTRCASPFSYLHMKLESHSFIALIAVLAAFALAAYLGRDFLRRSSRVPPVPRGTTVYRDIAYVTNGHPRQKLDLYLPKSAENPPLMILIHGGGFSEGDKREEDVAQWLTRGLRRRFDQLSLQQRRRFPRADRRLQGCGALAARECEEIWI